MSETRSQRVIPSVYCDSCGHFGPPFKGYPHHCAACSHRFPPVVVRRQRTAVSPYNEQARRLH